MRTITSISSSILTISLRMADPAPAHVGDVQEAVDAAQVDERAEVGDVLDRALADLADLDLGEQLLLHLLALVLDQLAAADDDVAPALVDLEDHALDARDRCTSPMSAGRRMSTWLAGRKTLTPMLTSRPPLILRVTTPVTMSPSLYLLDDLFPLLLAAGLAMAQHDGAAVVLDRFQQHLDLLADLGRHDLAGVVVVPLAQLDEALALVADVHPDALAGDAQDAAADDLVVAEILLVVGEPGPMFLRPKASSSSCWKTSSTGSNWRSRLRLTMARELLWIP